MVQLKPDHLFIFGIHQDAGVRAEKPAKEAVGARGFATNRPEGAPIAGVVVY
jgi:hypothetical protein